MSGYNSLHWPIFGEPYTTLSGIDSAFFINAYTSSAELGSWLFPVNSKSLNYKGY